MALLQVRLQEEGDVARCVASPLHLDLEQGEVLGPEPVPPRFLGLDEERVRHLWLSPDHAPVEEAQRDPGVLGGGGQHLGRPADRMVEVDALVPDRVPDAVGDGLDVPVAVVDEDHVEVAVGAQGAAAVPADGDQGHVPPGVTGSPVGEVGEPGIRFGGVAVAELLPREPGLGEEPGPALSEGCRGAFGR